MASSKLLLSPLTLASGQVLRNRVIMSPMTRDRSLIPGPLQAKYYRQRSTAGLIVSEGTLIESLGSEWPQAPGIYSEDQIEGWKKVTNAVHQDNGLIYCQLWHVGRLTHPLVNEGGKLPIGPSAIAAMGGKIPTPEGIKNYVQPRELTLDEIKDIINKYKVAALNAKIAGFDGVELHGAYGYLPDQFLHDGSNQRTDRYGGSIENRCRFMLEVLEAIGSVWGDSKRIGVKLSPSNTYNSMKDSDSLSLYTHLIGQLNQLNFISYLNMMEPSEVDIKHGATPIPVKTFRPLWKGALFANNNIDLVAGEEKLQNNEADGIVFGRFFISNPDLVARIKEGAPLAQPDYTKLYGGGEAGYTDYPDRHGNQLL